MNNEYHIYIHDFIGRLYSILPTLQLELDKKYCKYPTTEDTFDCTSIFSPRHYKLNDLSLSSLSDDAALRHYLQVGIKKGWSAHPEHRVMKIFLMNKNDLNLLKLNVLYHGEIFGFTNIYVIDGSTEEEVIQFLDRLKVAHGLNVFHTKANLNRIAGEYTSVMKMLSHSADYFVKIDTDELLTIPDIESYSYSNFSTYRKDTLAHFDNLPYDGARYMAANAYLPCRPSPLCEKSPTDYVVSTRYRKSAP